MCHKNTFSGLKIEMFYGRTKANKMSAFDSHTFFINKEGKACFQ